VGGETYDLTRNDVIQAVKDAPIETIHKHLVEIEGQAFPPKQVFGLLTGRPRQSFTTMEAQRVLKRLGFICRSAGQLEDGTPAWVASQDDPDSSPRQRLASLEAQIGTMQAAIVGLNTRLSALESPR
jgi:hypothetical protein